MVAPILTPFTDAAPCPRVEVFFEDFTPGTSHVTVYRLAGGREFQVRGAVMAPTGGTLTRIDFEAPFNVSVTYRAEQFDAAGISLGFTPSTTLGDVLEGLAPEDSLAPAPDLPPSVMTVGTGLISDDAWMHNPLNPQGSVRVTLLNSAVRSLSRRVPGEVSYPLGRRVGVMLSEPRRGLSGAVFDVFAETHSEADRVQEMIGSYAISAVPVICVRVGLKNPMRVSMPLFLGVNDIPEEDVSVRYGGEETVQRIEGDEVSPPIPGLFIPLLTRADLNAFFATRADLNAGGLRRVDLNRRYDLAGVAEGV